MLESKKLSFIYFKSLSITFSGLGPLTYLHIWHDNSGQGGSASWFLKFLIVHDLQTRERAYFICNGWLAVDKSDGLIDRILPVATGEQTGEIKYLIEKQTKEKLSDKHLWFSVFARPTKSSFNRSDRVTCCFVLLYLTMLTNAVYYERDESKTSGAFIIGPFSVSQAQVL